MKGMEMTTNITVTIVIIVILLLAVTAFLLTQSSTQISISESRKIFESKCASYGQRGYEWAVTRDSSFSEFVTACKAIYGEDHEGYSCLYQLCSKTTPPQDLQCEGICRLCEGLAASGASPDACCVDFSNKCGISCGACP